MRIIILFLSLAITACNGYADTLPTAEFFGDSVTIGASGPARFNLVGLVDFRHAAWGNENIAPADTWAYEVLEMNAATNNGSSINLLHYLQAHTSAWHRDVILFNAGYHDMNHTADSLKPAVSLGSYLIFLEQVADILQAHGDVVIWVDTPGLPADSTGRILVQAALVPEYNAAAEQVAREHGFYILNLDSKGHLPGNVHYDFAGYKRLGLLESECVLIAMHGRETSLCHH
jgi:hypothetical protein